METVSGPASPGLWAACLAPCLGPGPTDVTIPTKRLVMAPGTNLPGGVTLPAKRTHGLSLSQGTLHPLAGVPCIAQKVRAPTYSAPRDSDA